MRLFGADRRVMVAAAVGALNVGCTEVPNDDGDPVVAQADHEAVTSFDGVSIAYETFGAGAVALMFVHGWSCDRSYWREQMGPFSASFRTVSVDLAGHGESGDEREAWTIAGYGADVAAVAEGLDLSQIILVGHSLGGDAVVSAARLLGEKVLGLIWVDDYSQLGAVRTADQVSEFLAPFQEDFSGYTYALVREAMFPPTADPSLVERVATDMSSAPPAIALPSLRSSITNDRVVPSELEKLALPVVSLNPAISNPDVESLEEHGVSVILVPELGHFMMLEDPEAFNVILMDAVQRILAAR